MNYDVLHNFISPVTGRVPLIKDYILIGGANNFSIMSPKLIDMQLDIIDIRHEFDTLAASKFIIGFPNTQLPNSQVLNSLPDGFMFNTGGIVSTTNNIPLPNLTYNNIWIGDITNQPVANLTISLDNLPLLNENKMWAGDINNRPIEINIDFAPDNATYILKTPQTKLVNAQALSELAGGILKSTPVTGVLTNAIAGIDYASEASVVAAQATADAAAAQAAAAPAEGAALAALYFNEQMLPYSLIPVVPVGVSISTAIGAAVASAANAQSTADNANTRLDNLNITLQGDVLGTGNLNTPIITAFIPNPRFTGKEYIKIPVGNIAERPSNPEMGMVRYNLEI